MKGHHKTLDNKSGVGEGWTLHQNPLQRKMDNEKGMANLHLIVRVGQ